MVKFKSKSTVSVKALLGVLNELGAQIASSNEPLSPQDFSYAMAAIQMSPKNYGLVDLDEEQHLGLLYFWMVQERKYWNANKSGDLGTIAWARKRKAELDWSAEWDEAWDKRNLQGDFYKLAFIGRGAACAYYVGALGEGYDHRYSVVVGALDAWRVNNQDVFSRGGGYINHERHLIAHWDDGVPAFSLELHDRDAFADANERILARIEKHIDAGVASISKPDSWYAIRLRNGKTLYALKVVVGMGAGPHIHPSKRKVKIADAIPPGLILDLDSFMRMYSPVGAAQGGKTVIVHGPNAGIDAVERAGERGFGNVYWFMSQESNPAFLPGNRLRHAPYTVPTKLKQVPRESKESVLALSHAGDNKLKVDYLDPDSTPKTILADHYVYALGQDPDAEGAVRQVLDRDTIYSKLEPVFDSQLRYSDDARAAIVALRQAGTDPRNGLEIIGAAVEILLQGEEGKLLMKVVESQPATVARFGQLGAIKSAIGAQGSVMPSYVTQTVNFTTDDRTVLRTHIAVKYPGISVEMGDKIVEDILAHRRSDPKTGKNGFHPLGYDAWWKKHWEHVLAYWNTPTSERDALARRQAFEMEQLEKTLEGPPGFTTG
jgi:hypothetical protein